MMKMFVSKNAVLFILVVITTIDASRLFYLPLPKIHSSSHQQIPTPKILEETKNKPISDEFIPSSAIEREEIEKRGDNFDWEELLDREAARHRHRIAVNELLPKSLKYLEKEDQSNEPFEKKMKIDRLKQLNVDKISHYDREHDFKEPWIADNTVERVERLQSNAALNHIEKKTRRNDTLFIIIVGACCVIGVAGLIGAAIFWYKVQKRAEEAVDTEYPSYGVTGPSSAGGKISPSSSMSDRKLAQSAQMFHYQQQRQAMMAQENRAHLDAKATNSDDSDDEAPADGDYTVYECPGLAPTGEMEVRNPLFTEPDSLSISSTSGSHPATNVHYPQPSTSISSSPPKEKSSP